MSIPPSYEHFKATFTDLKPNSKWPDGLKCLWYDANDNWEAAHDIAQDMNNEIGSLLHAYLHRKEGDDWNAGYWYSKAGRQFPETGLEEEFESIVKEVLETVG